MKVVVAPQAFKESLTAVEVAEAMAEGVRRVFSDVELVLRPVADGGDGTLDTLVRSMSGRLFPCVVTGPLGRPLEARWGVLGDGRTAVVEAAQACGLALVPSTERDPTMATTYGVGELVKAALDAGYRRLVVGVGGTATTDGGAGMAQALGVRLLDATGQDLPHGGAALLRLARVEVGRVDSRVGECEVLVAADVNNPLCGPLGAAQTYGPQKGASRQSVEQLDQALARLDHVLRAQLSRGVGYFPGAGAGGGLGAGLLAFLGARLVPGAELVCDVVGLDGALDAADLVLTGEGRLDWQTAYGKAPLVVARSALAKGVPVLGICGVLGPGHEQLHAAGFRTLGSIVHGAVTQEEAMRRAGPLLVEATERLLRAASVTLQV